MNGLTDQTPRTDPRCEPMAGPEPPPQVTWLKHSAKKLGGGIFFASIVAIAMNYGGVKWGVLTAFSAVVHVFGDPLAGRAGGIIEKIEGKIDKVASPVPRAPTFILRETHETPEWQAKQREVREALEKQHKIDKWHARAHAIGLEYDDTWPLGKFEVDVPIAERRVAEAAERKPLQAEADKLGLLVSDDWDNKKLREEIKIERKFRADDTSYQEKLRLYRLALERHREFLRTGPNARCACGHSTRFSAARVNTQFLCPRCRNISPVSQAMARWRPPSPPKPPTPPSRNQSFFNRLFR